MSLEAAAVDDDNGDNIIIMISINQKLKSRPNIQHIT